MTDLMFHCAIWNFRISNSSLPCCFSRDFLYFSMYKSTEIQKKNFTSSMYNILEIFGWNLVFKSCPSLYIFFNVPNTPQSYAEYVHGTLLLLCVVMYG